MKIIRTKDELVALRNRWKQAQERIGLVPTMGALHEGHLSLVEAAKAQSDRVIVTIFVNPKQFDNPEDLEKYPRLEEDDIAQLAPYKIDALYIPTPDQIYPNGFATTVSIENLTDDLEGAHRLGHFDGVSTVVAKLFLQTRADAAFFGEKDYQQLMLVRRLSEDLDIDTQIIGCATLREADGLAMSSRNLRLSKSERLIAPILHQQMQQAAKSIANGAEIHKVLEKAKAEIVKAGFKDVEYLELRSAKNLQISTDLTEDMRLLAAANLGSVRLIDNIPIN